MCNGDSTNLIFFEPLAYLFSVSIFIEAVKQYFNQGVAIPVSFNVFFNRPGALKSFHFANPAKYDT